MSQRRVQPSSRLVLAVACALAVSAATAASASSAGSASAHTAASSRTLVVMTAEAGTTARLKAYDALDKTFDGDGKVFTTGIGESIADLKLQTDGKIVDMTGSAVWTSSDPSKATVDATGVATGIAAGAVTITAASGPNGAVKGSTAVTVQ